MNVVCAWCSKHMRGDPASILTSHSICQKCSDGMVGLDSHRNTRHYDFKKPIRSVPHKDISRMWIDIGGEG